MVADINFDLMQCAMRIVDKLCAFNIAESAKCFTIYTIAGLSACNVFGLLRGNSFENRGLLFMLRSFFFSLMYFPVRMMSPLTANLLLAYFPLYTDLSEHHFGCSLSSWFKCSFIGGLLKRKFNMKLIKTAEITDKQCLVGLHPHGILPLGSIINVVSNETNFENLFPTLTNRVVLAASSCFLVPVFRELLISNRIRDCSRFNAMEWLKKCDNDGNPTTVFIVPGGAQEGLYSRPDMDWLDLKRKKGFIRLAVIYGIPLVPSYTFNEVDYCFQSDFESVPTVIHMARRWLWQKTIGISLPFLYWFKFNNISLTTVIGKPIVLPYKNILEPTNEQLEECMDIYIKALRELYDVYSKQYNSRERELIIS